jgi:hypothetical protein
MPNEQHLIFVTCTYDRPLRIAYLRRHIEEIFSKIENYTWIIVEDGDSVHPEVQLMTAGLNTVHLHFGPTRDKGHAQRDFALQTIRERRLEGVVYNMDDDNFCYRLICAELRKVTKIAIFPVGNLGPTGIERPVIHEGKLVFWSAHFTERAYPVDVGGLAFPSRFLFDLEPPFWPYKGIVGESELVSRLVEAGNELDLSLCHANRMCLVYHNEPIDSPYRAG